MNKYVLTVAAFAMALCANAQQHAPLTAQDYERAERFLSFNTSPLVDRANVFTRWLPNGKLTYSVSTPNGTEFVLVDPVKKSRTVAFDAKKLAAAVKKLKVGDPRDEATSIGPVIDEASAKRIDG
ncbi:MAG: aldehyde dehydrogenase family protein, partial [Sphingobacteriales bacterium]